MRTRRFFGASALAILATLALVTSAFAGDDGGKRQFRSDTLTGYQEVVGPGPISTVGTGTFTAELTSDSEITYHLTYTGLEGVGLDGRPTQAHIHFGQRSVGGGIIAFLCGGGPITNPKPACPASPGDVRGTITPADIIGPTNQGIEPGSFAEAVRALRAGVVYANVHTARWPAGEIRGQVNDRGQNQKDDE